MGTNLIRISACNEQQQHFGEGESVAARAMKEIALKGEGQRRIKHFEIDFNGPQILVS